MGEHVLVGRVIHGMHLSQDRESIIFDTDAGPVIARTFGDCCSYTWIENVEGEEDLIGRKVVSVEDIPMPELGNVGTPFYPDVDEVSYYGTKITTDGGVCVIDYRNDSNGYYGGDLDWAELRLTNYQHLWRGNER